MAANGPTVLRLDRLLTDLAVQQTIVALQLCLGRLG
jgi:hypothetical protein